MLDSFLTCSLGFTGPKAPLSFVKPNTHRPKAEVGGVFSEPAGQPLTLQTVPDLVLNPCTGTILAIPK
jgi:hypothetical protein